MDSSKKGNVFQELEKLSDLNIQLSSAKKTSVPFYKEQTMICKSLHSQTNSKSKLLLPNQPIEKMKKKDLVQNMNYLTNLVSQHNADDSFIELAKIIKNAMTPEQKRIFISELEKQDKHSNDEYISYEENCPSKPAWKEDQSVARSGVPGKPNDLFDSINLSSLNDPTESNVQEFGPNSKKFDKEYLVHQGIQYCRSLLQKSFKTRDHSVLVELGKRNVIHIVLNEMIVARENYITQLANKYPDSYNEILFIMEKNKDLILQSSIFVNLAQLNIHNLYDFLLKLLNDGFDKNDLIKNCYMSNFFDQTVLKVINANHKNGDVEVKNKIHRFLDKYNESPRMA